MHKVIETLEELGFPSELSSLELERFDNKRGVRTYEKLYSAVLEAQEATPQSDGTNIEPFAFVASASMRAESTCWEWPCRLQKLDFLGRYSALYADTVTVPLCLRAPHTVRGIAWAKSLLSHAGLTLLRLRLLIDAGLVQPVVMVSQHCEHTQPWVDEMIELTHSVAAAAGKDLAHKFRLSYQLPEKSPTGRSTIYVKGPEDFLEHGELVELFDEGPQWRPRNWKYNRVGKHELGGARKLAVVQRVFRQIATETTFYLAYGRARKARYLTDRRGEAFLLEMLTGDEELAASSHAMNAYMKHTLPLLGDLPIATLLDIRRQERNSFARYRLAVQSVLEDVGSRNKRITKKEILDAFKGQIEPQLLKMKSELQQERHKQRNRVAGGLAALAASVGLGAFGSIVPLLVKVSMVGASAMVGGRLLSKAAEAKCEHGATLKERNDFYFLLRLEQEVEKN